MNMITAAEARNNFADLLSQVGYGGKRFVIKKSSKPTAVIMGMEEYRRLSRLKEELFKEIRAIQEKNKSKSYKQVNKDIEEAIRAVRK